MLDTVYAAAGAGLAAIQMGVPKRVVVIDILDKRDASGKAIRNPQIFINPEISASSPELAVHREG